MLSVGEADVVANRWVVQNLRNMLPYLALRMDDTIYLEFGQDAVMIFGRGLGPDGSDANGLEINGRKYVRFDIGAKRDAPDIDCVYSGFTQGSIIACVKNESLPEIFDKGGNMALIDIGADFVVAKSLQVARKCAAERAQPDHREIARFFWPRRCSLNKLLEGEILPPPHSNTNAKM